jgi:2,3-bisphosphoglycerate-independent phosphoglycerate mutase
MQKINRKTKDALPMILLILDGWGVAEKNKGNPFGIAKTPYMNGLLEKYPNTLLHAHGKYIGLSREKPGNSESGHMNIGAGRVIEQDAVRIDKSIKNGTFFRNSAFLGAIRHVKKMKSKLHIMGMISVEESPHSSLIHLTALLKLLKKKKVTNVYVHFFTDGRDSPKYSSLELIDDFEKNHLNGYKIATVMGRFYAMDRKKEWSRTEKAYDALTLNRARSAKSVKMAITESYNKGDSDEFIEPYIINNRDNTRIGTNDSLLFFNLRSDRSRQLTKVFVQENFSKMNPKSFKRKKKLRHLYFVSMTDFGPDLDDVLTAYPGIDIEDTLPTQLEDLKQLYIAETEKYAHVTYFFNGGYSGTVAGEDQFMIKSPNVKSYDETPLMSSEKLTRAVINNLKNNKYDFCVLNLAAPDMIGHTGNMKAAIKCIEGVDRIVSRITEAYLKKNGTVVITADHGNIEKMINLETEEIFTEHTCNKVPFIIANKYAKNNIKLRKSGSLSDIVPTVLQLLNRKKSVKIKGKSLIK